MEVLHKQASSSQCPWLVLSLGVAEPKQNGGSLTCDWVTRDLPDEQAHASERYQSMRSHFQLLEKV